MTPAEIAKRRQIEDAILAQGVDTSPVGHWTQGLARVANAMAGAYRRGRLDDAEAESNRLGTEGYQTAIDILRNRATAGSAIPMSEGAAEAAATVPTSGQPIDMTGNEVYDQFMGTVKEGVTNPYALAAIAATGKAESGFSPANVNRTWSDPSESGQAGTAGGIMSWRGPRYQALAATGDLSPAGQARFFLGEDPGLIEKLNNAQSVEEAQSLMNNAWKFAGYNRPGGEAANRLSYANSFLPTFQGQGGAEVASLDPTAGMAEGAIVPGAEPIVSSSLADEVAEYEGTPEYAARFGNTTGQPLADNEFDKRFGDTPLPAEQLQGRAAIEQALVDQQQRATGGQQAIASQTAGMPVTGQAAQPDGIMQAISGTNAGGTFGLNPMQMQVAQAVAGQDPLMSEEFLRAMGNPHMTPEQRSIVQALVERRMKADLFERQQRAERENWLFQQDYQRQQQEADPLRQLEIQKARRELETPIKRGTTTINGRLVDDQTGQVIAEFPDRTKPTADQQNYEYYRDYETRNGRTPLGPLEWEQSLRRAGATNINTGESGADSELRKKLSGKEGEAWAAYKEAGTVSAGTVQDMQLLDELIKQAPQGPIQGRLAQAFPGFSTAGSAFESIVKRVAPTLRAPGSGATSDIEYDGMLRSLPALTNYPEANAAISEMMKAKADINMARSSVIDRYQNEEITAAQARREMAKLNSRSIMTPRIEAAFEQLGIDVRKPSDGSMPMTGDEVDGYRFKGGNPSDQNNWEKVR